MHNSNLTISSHYLKRLEYNNLRDIYRKRNHLDLIIIQSTRKLWGIPLENTEQNKKKEKRSSIKQKFEKQKGKIMSFEEDELSLFRQ